MYLLYLTWTLHLAPCNFINLDLASRTLITRNPKRKTCIDK
jgi:hypothetical protein